MSTTQKRIVLILTEEQAKALSGTFSSADRGREDYEYLVSQGNDDYAPADIANAREWHQREIKAENEIWQMIALQTPYTEQDAEHLANLLTQPAGEQWQAAVDLLKARSLGRVDLGDAEAVDDLNEALAAVEAATEGDSNDNEISALQDALSAALSRWPELRKD